MSADIPSGGTSFSRSWSRLLGLAMQRMRFRAFQIRAVSLKFDSEYGVAAENPRIVRCSCPSRATSCSRKLDQMPQGSNNAHGVYSLCTQI